LHKTLIVRRLAEDYKGQLFDSERRVRARTQGCERIRMETCGDSKQRNEQDDALALLGTNLEEAS